MIRSVDIIARNTFKEIIRDRILYILIVFGLLFFLVSLALGTLSVQEQVRISVNFGFTAIHFSSIVLSIFVGGALVTKEIDKKTVLTLLVRPVSRGQFVVGKALGLGAVIAVVIVGFGLVMSPVIYFLGMPPDLRFAVGLLGVLLESFVILGVAVLLSSFTRPVMIASCTFGIFLIGHFLDSLKFFADKSDSPLFKGFSNVIRFVFPDLERFNWRSLFVYGDNIPWAHVGFGLLYGFFWFILFIAATNLILSRKDFV